MISFQAGAEDAQSLAREFYPVFEAGDLIELPRYHIYLKMMIGGSTCKPFSAKTLPPPSKPGISLKREIVEFSRLKYGRSKVEVEFGLIVLDEVKTCCITYMLLVLSCGCYRSFLLNRADYHRKWGHRL